MLLVRSLRPDRVLFAAAAFVANALGRAFVEPPVLDLGETFGDSSAVTPLIFVLSPGVDPTEGLKKLAAEKGMRGKLFSVALGQGQVRVGLVGWVGGVAGWRPLVGTGAAVVERWRGEARAASAHSVIADPIMANHNRNLPHNPPQAPTAQRLIEEGAKSGHWVFLANCHLMTSWLPTLDKIIEGLETAASSAAAGAGGGSGSGAGAAPHASFRLWLSSNPSEAFPISILQV